MLQQYKEKKEQVLKLVQEVYQDSYISEGAIRESGLQQSVERLESGIFRIALVAPFSAGKSTFINALIGKDLLSMNILAETAAITTLKYSEKKRIEVFYQDGSQEVFPSDDSLIDDQVLRRFLKEKTTVQREGEEDAVEDTIERVDVYWDLPLCKDGVEIIDTPGLGFANEKHSEITERLLPTLNAVLFMIEPAKVGQKDFMSVIKDRVENVKHSNLEKEGRHIFFIMNRIDQHPPEDIETAKRGLIEVLKPLIPSPQIYGVSSYFALKSRMFMNQEIGIDDLQKDIQIRMIDEEGYPVMGKGIEPHHVNQLFTQSRIQELEDGLANYLEQKNSFLIENVISDIVALYHREITDLEQSIEVMKGMNESERQAGINKLTELKDFFKKGVRDTRKKIERIIGDRFYGQSEGGSGLEHIAIDVKEQEIPILMQDLRMESGNYWNTNRIFINESNVEKIFESLEERINFKAGISRKTLIRTSFIELTKVIEDIRKIITNQFEEFEHQANEAFQEKLSVFVKPEDSFFDMNIIINSMKIEIEKKFSEVLILLSEETKNRIKKDRLKHVNYRLKSGILNRIKSWFGHGEKVREFDQFGFREDMTSLAYEVIEDACKTMRDEANSISETIAFSFKDLIVEFEHKIDERLKVYGEWRDRLIQDMEQEFNDKETSLAEHIDNKKRKRAELMQKVKLMSIQETEEGLREVAASEL